MNMASGIYLNESVWSSPLVKSGRGPTLEETWLDDAIRSSVAITKLPLGRDILKQQQQQQQQIREM